ncbi:MAG TPA: type II toxin-antitoxin system VapC family toxin [Candidatus Nanoarchaeia archaeon]|nr:type II toxin-antitoxin system VapC family toxin [Candidatus Nanoarchaeia archaeon]
MRFCTDTWFLMKIFANDQKARDLVRRADEGKDWILIPLIAFAEMTKKMMMEGISQLKINEFFNDIERVEKVKMIYPSKEIANEAAKVSLSYKLSLLDAFVAATAKNTGCDVLLSADSDYRLIMKQKYLKVQSW